MAKMVDMKSSKAERKAEREPVKMDGDAYPYGLSVRLDHHSLKKLGMHDKLPKVGDKIKLHAHAHVTSVSDHSSEGGESQKHVELQLRHMGVEGMGKNLEKPDGDTEEGMKKGAKAAMDKVLGPKEEGSDSQDGSEE
jgi:hypothetical protein